MKFLNDFEKKHFSILKMNAEEQQEVSELTGLEIDMITEIFLVNNHLIYQFYDGSFGICCITEKLNTEIQYEEFKRIVNNQK